MIKHYIQHPKNKYTPPPSSGSWSGAVFTPHRNQSSMYQGAIAPRRMTKLEFAQYQNSKGFKVGDFVIRPTASPPFTGLDVLRIIYVEEMHHQIGDHEWSHKGEPMCYHIQNVNGASQNTYWKSTLDFVRKEPLTYEELPFEWRVLVDKERVADRAAEEFAGDCA